MRRGGRRDALCKGCSALCGCVKSGAADGPENTCVPDVLLCGDAYKSLSLILPGAKRASNHIKECSNWSISSNVTSFVCVCVTSTQNIASA